MEKNSLFTPNKCLEMVEVFGQLIIHADNKPPISIRINHNLKIYFELKNKLDNPVGDIQGKSQILCEAKEGSQLKSQGMIQESMSWSKNEIVGTPEFVSLKETLGESCNERVDTSELMDESKSEEKVCPSSMYVELSDRLQKAQRSDEINGNRNNGKGPDICCDFLVQSQIMNDGTKIASGEDSQKGSELCSENNVNSIDHDVVTGGQARSMAHTQQDHRSIYQYSESSNVKSEASTQRKPPPCHYCKRKFKNFTDKKKHTKHLRNVSCDKCNAILTSQAELSLHQYQNDCANRNRGNLFQTNIKKNRAYIKCPMCPKRFVNTTIIDHICKVHTKECLYKCCVCQKLFFSQRTLCVHSRDHLKASKEFSCVSPDHGKKDRPENVDSTCPSRCDSLVDFSSVPSMDKMNDNSLSGVTENLHPEKLSENANKASVSNEKDLFHLERSSGHQSSSRSSFSRQGRPYKTKPCKYCGKLFENPSDKEKHNHGYVTIAKCLKCSQVFSCRAKLIAHEHEEHSDSKVAQSDNKCRNTTCPLCLKGVCKASLVDHISVFHTKELKCKCCVCGLLFYSSRQLYDHAVAHSNPEKSKVKGKFPKSCSYCGKCFESLEDKEMHHQGPAPSAECQRCCCVFSCQAKLLAHDCIKCSDNKGDVLRDIHKNNQVFRPCPICSDQIKKNNLVDHISSMHTRELKNKCCVCEEAFFTNRQLYDHALGHVDPNKGRRKGQWRCSLCPQVFYDKSEFHKHSYTHSTTCVFCKQDFGHKHFLDSHYQREHADQLLKCNICDKQVATQAQLKTHMRYHRYVKSVPCPFCGVFISNRFLPFHIDKTHSEKPKGESDGSKLLLGDSQMDTSCCSKSNRDINSLPSKVSRSNISSSCNTFLCSYCPLTFSKKRYLQQHTYRVHSSKDKISCPRCQKQVSKSKLSTHIRNVHLRSKVHTCEICGKQCTIKSNLTIHMRTHSQVKPFSCGICEQKFNYKASLKNHLKSKHKLN